MTRLQTILLCAATFVANAALDRVTKILAVAHLKDSAPIALLRDTIVLYYAENSGAFLSLGADWPTAIKYALLLVIPMAACAAGFVYCCAAEMKLARALLIVTVLAGGSCNLFDRITNDFRVIDFMNFGIGSLRTGVLNVADLSVTFGAIALVIYEWKTTKKQGA
jgi:signal peptidase II